MRSMITLALAVIAGTVSAQSEPEKVAIPFEATTAQTESALGKIPAPMVSVPRSASSSADAASTEAVAASTESEPAGSSSRKPAFETVAVPRQSAAPAIAPVETVTVPAATQTAAPPVAVETVPVPVPVPAPVTESVASPVLAAASVPVEAPVAEVVVLQPEALPVPVQVSAAPVSTGGFGSSTRSWTELQTSGVAASAEARPLPGEAASNAYDRYLRSFTHPIPEKFERDSFSTEDGGN